MVRPGTLSPHFFSNNAKDQGLLRLPLPLQHNTDFPTLCYADNTLIIMEGCRNQLVFLKSLLNTFADSTSLKVNYKQEYDGAN